MNRDQRNDLAKVFYDFAKITFAALIIGNIATRDHFDTLAFIYGIIFITSLLIIGLMLQSKRGRKIK